MRLFAKIILLFAITATACTQKTSNLFKIDGEIKGRKDGLIFISYTDPQTTLLKRDSVGIVDGKFSFNGEITMPVEAFISDENYREWNNPNMVSLFIEPTKMQLTLEWGNFSNYTLNGSAANDQYVVAEKARESASKKLKELYDKSQVTEEPELKEALEKEMQELREQLKLATEEFMTQNPNSVVSAYYLKRMMSQYNLEQIESYYNPFSEYVKNSTWSQEIKTEIDLLSSLKPDNPAPLFTSTDINGNTLSLADFKGKYVLIDFWASWCVPCRQGNSHLKELWKKYNKEGFEIICIADNDSSPDKWREAVKQDQIEMFHHILRGLKSSKTSRGYEFDRTNDISALYAIHYLPTKYLIDNQGNIIEGFISNENLDKQLEKIFGE